MGVEDDWPAFCPNLELKLDVTNGTLSFVSPSKLVNYADYDVTNKEVRGAIFKNGVKQGSLTISATDGAITAGTFSVSTGDTIEVRVRAVHRTSLPWYTHAALERSAVMTVPSGNSQTTFDGSNNVVTVPSFDLAFGWDANNNFKVGVKVTASDNASQSFSVTTRLHGTCPNAASSTTFSATDTTNTQTHVASFTKSDMTSEAVLEMSLQSAASAPYQKDRWLLFFQEGPDVPTYPTGFPTSGTLLKQERVANSTKLRLYRP
ncbi:MAG: hypothetical protein ACOZNI_27195 [Myxococcota bacterium]